MGVGGHRGYQPGHQGDVRGTSNTSLRWRKDCIVGLIHCPSPGFHPALQCVHTLDEAAVSPTSAVSPPLDLSLRTHRFGSEVGRNCKSAGDQLLEEKGGIQVSPSALTDHCDSRLAPRLLRQSWVCFLPPHTKIAAESQDHCSHSSPRATGPRPALRPLWMGNADQEALVLGD